MANIVTSSDLTSASTDNMSSIESVITSSGSISGKIDSFITESKEILKGGGYDNVRIKLLLYIKVLETLKIICENAENNVKVVNNSMINYMEGYSRLDDSQVSEIEQRLASIKGYLAYLQSENSKSDTDYSSLIEYWVGIYNQLDHYKNLLKGLAGEDATLFGNLDNLITDIENITRAVHGIDVSTFTKAGLEALKNGTGKIYQFNPDEAVFGYQIDTARMSARAIATLNEITKNWPDDMEEQRLVAIETALSLLDKGIAYSMPGRHAKDKDGNPISMDCSSFVTYCLIAAGVDVPATAYTGTYLSNENFTPIDRSQLKPGDVGLINSSGSGNGANHIGMYLGKDSQGREVWIECTGSKAITISYGPGNWRVFRRYNKYN